MNEDHHTETIAAIATPPGRGGVGIVRVSGPQAAKIAKAILKTVPPIKTAFFSKFYSENDEVLDEGIALFFQNPHSFTGEDVLELQGHGGPIILDSLLKQVIHLGARLARPGEFSERAFLNDKIDLTQAEAVADLIDAATEQAAKSAVRSLCGEFSQKIKLLVEEVIHLRMYVEAAIDFPEEEIDFLADKFIAETLNKIIAELAEIRKSAKQGAILREGMTVVIAGKPNVGKSSLLNALSGIEAAIVSQIAGTTRDVLKEKINIDGMPLHIIDTAGLRESEDVIEQEGIKRAKQAIAQADEILLLMDATENNLSINESLATYFKGLSYDLAKVTVIKNKIDKTKFTAGIKTENDFLVIYLSAKEKIGLALLKEHLKEKVGYQAEAEGIFMARRRHLEALTIAANHLQQGRKQLTEYKAGDFLAEELRLTQQALNEITGEFTNEDLLTRIFSSFCIGK
ncbi:MAG: tRNA uridine-5-carboxymethylaminomethyl(34) synthesis GTPase MnmE [Gammaproteobacteria bacterium RIFCSPHIGHO2_12_FULL_35_23]|nr:MAG: tRNA uridine-5-carboxymethylaminomethyl(34) synthesis GTPase MnmE [Gammaproteobacteria bacterium RIFCSPHIGHO2_12_FULL_35_23]